MSTELITIIGGGVSGLTTACILQKSGFKVRIIAREPFEKTVSAKAAAIWFPFFAKPVHKVNAWSLRSFEYFLELCHKPESGISLVPFTVYEESAEKPYWYDALPKKSTVKPTKVNVFEREAYSYSIKIPLIETQLYLPYLRKKFLDQGGLLEERTINSLNEFDENEWVVNCTGLGSMHLVSDKNMYPIKGQIVKVASHSSVMGLSLEFPVDDKNEELIYVIPRKDCIVIGGSAIPNDDTEDIDHDLTKRMLHRASQIEPRLRDLEIQTVLTGMRPGRTSIRLEKEEGRKLIHNYGHGGSGFTVAWGCAEEISQIISNNTH
ncbi:FAD-dependent oxidoreductase [Balneola vulgaris]|uniref:FAD-dependent oxidoreductase n=1 Tax=Balneola vulgaris TaxID=287535 RepID=UPI00037ADCC8|nr:FAD-dependent oxidoreductase [Balneola vulgaris]